MNNLYHIQGLCPDRRLGGCGFCIQLWPDWKVLVAKRALTQENVNAAIGNMGRSWLDGCGYDRKWNPEASYEDRDKPPGPNAKHLYEPRTSIRVSWRKWGPEHITVPGNACGLDIDEHGLGKPPGGTILVPHNVDSISQAHLLLVVFLFFADTLILNWECEELGINREASCERS